MLYPLPQTERLIHFADESPSVDVKFANAVPDGRASLRTRFGDGNLISPFPLLL